TRQPGKIHLLRLFLGGTNAARWLPVEPGTARDRPDHRATIINFSKKDVKKNLYGKMLLAYYFCTPTSERWPKGKQ
ncbi:MAG: hypothetical protein ACK5UX_02405, partial [Burkholderiales bacterium]